MKVPPNLIRHLGTQVKDDAPDTALVKMGTLRGWMAQLFKMIPVPAGGIYRRHTLNGEEWSVADSGTTGNMTVGTDGQVTPGLVGGVMPTIDGVRLDDESPALLEISDSGTVYVVMQVNSTLATMSGAFVQSLSVNSVQIYTSGTEPGPGGLESSTGTFTFLLATFVNGVRTYQATAGDWYLDVIDSRDGSGTGNIVRLLATV